MAEIQAGSDLDVDGDLAGGGGAHRPTATPLSGGFRAAAMWAHIEAQGRREPDRRRRFQSDADGCTGLTAGGTLDTIVETSRSDRPSCP